jgi:signal transduction histidine kinase
MIAEQADRCKKIVSGLLNFARQNKVFLQPARVADLMDQALRSVPIPENITVRTENPVPDLVGDVDPDQMLQVLTNLVSNAVESMPGGGTLTLASGSQNGTFTLSVSDTGTGITKEHMNKIFEPFFTTKPMGKGTGLGLPVTYGIVKMHRGDIRVDSNADSSSGPTGTTFRVTLPTHGQGEG